MIAALLGAWLFVSDPCIPSKPVELPRIVDAGTTVPMPRRRWFAHRSLVVA